MTFLKIDARLRAHNATFGFAHEGDSSVLRLTSGDRSVIVNVKTMSPSFEESVEPLLKKWERKYGR